MLTKIGKTKSERLRKRVDATKGSTCMQLVNMKAIFNDKSQGKQSTHFKLKSYIFDQGQTTLNNFTKNELIKLCNGNGIKMSTSNTHAVIREKLCSVIPSVDAILHPEYLQESFISSESIAVSKSAQSIQPGSSTATTSTLPSLEFTGKKLQKRKRKCKTNSKFTAKSKSKSSKQNLQNVQEDQDTVCPLCKSVYVEGQDWIACDICDLWYDRKCLNLTEDQWNGLEDMDWYCPQCLK